MARKSRRETLTPELTPLIDVVFILLIFFMVSSVFKKEELALLLNLPKTAQGKSSKAAPKKLVIEVSSDQVAINNEKISFEDVDEFLKKQDSKTEVELRVDGKVVYDRLVKILDLLQKNKLENLSLITDKVPPQ